jgi:hypothetical protein
MKWRELGGFSAAFSANPVASERGGIVVGFDQFNPGRNQGIANTTTLTGSLLDYWLLCPSLKHRIERVGQTKSRRTLGEVAAYTYSRILNNYWRYPQIEREVRKVLQSKDPRLPTYLFFNLMEAHEPYFERGSQKDLWEEGDSPTFSLSTVYRGTGRTPRTWESFASQYLAAVRRLDRRVEGIFDALFRGGMLESTTFLLVSDHGQALGESGFVGHGHHLFDSLTNIPGYIGTFSQGTPKPMPIPTHRSLDLRHLHDLLDAVMQNGEPGLLSEELEASLSKRGHPAAYWEDVPHTGVVLKAPNGPISRALRLFSDSGSICFRQSGIDSPMLERVDGQLQPSEEDELLAEGSAIIGGQAGELDQASGWIRTPDEVTAQLQTWGYL